MSVVLKEVKLLYPSLVNKATFSGISTDKYQASFLLDETQHKDVIVALRKEIAQEIGKSGLKIPKDKYCVKHGSDFEDDFYNNQLIVRSSNRNEILLIDRQKEPIVDKSIFYSGCIVTAVIDIWIQNNQYGKRVNSTVRLIQFVQDGEKLDLAEPDPQRYIEQVEYYHDSPAELHPHQYESAKTGQPEPVFSDEVPF